MNWRIHGELKAWDGDIENEIRRLFALLDSQRRFSIGLWALPEGVPLDKVNHKKWPQEYIQAAGSREGMVVEVRTLTGRGPVQSVIGRDVAPESAATEIVRWNDVENRVFPREVFDAAEAGELFVSYYASGDVAAGYVGREIVVAS